MSRVGKGEVLVQTNRQGLGRWFRGSLQGLDLEHSCLRMMDSTMMAAKRTFWQAAAVWWDINLSFRDGSYHVEHSSFNT